MRPLSDDELCAWWEETIAQLHSLAGTSDRQRFEIVASFCEALADEANRRVRAGIWWPSDINERRREVGLPPLPKPEGRPDP